MAYTFSRVDSACFVVSSNSAIANVSPMTISAWIFPLWSSPTVTQRIFTQEGTGATEGGLNFYINNANTTMGALFFELKATTATMLVQSTQNSIMINRWLHVAVTWDGTLTATGTKLYINGTQSALYQTRTNGVGTIRDYSASRVAVGAHSILGRCFSGGISEMAFWNTTLGDADILNLSSSRIRRLPLQIRPDKLIGYFPMDESIDGVRSVLGTDTIFDMSSNKVIGVASSGTSGNTPIGIAENALSYQ